LLLSAVGRNKPVRALARTGVSGSHRVNVPETPPRATPFDKLWTGLGGLIPACHKKVNPQYFTNFQVITPHEILLLKKNAKKGLVDAVFVFVFVNHAHFRDNANGVNQTCHIGCPLSVASVQHH
jgi:hypothetical protein